MAVTTLETFPLAGDPEARRASVAARQAAYTAAVEFMRAADSLPITVEDVAHHAEVSTVELRDYETAVLEVADPMPPRTHLVPDPV